MMVSLEYCYFGLRHHKGGNHDARMRFAKERLSKSRFQRRFQLLVREFRREKMKELSPILSGARRKNPAPVILVKGVYVINGKMLGKPERYDCAGGGAGDHVEIACKRSAAAQRRFALPQYLYGVDALDAAAIELKNFEVFVFRPRLLDPARL